MSDTIPCPQCGATAEIAKRFWLDSTDGPIQHLTKENESSWIFEPRLTCTNAV